MIVVFIVDDLTRRTNRLDADPFQNIPKVASNSDGQTDLGQIVLIVRCGYVTCKLRNEKGRVYNRLVMFETALFF